MLNKESYEVIKTYKTSENKYFLLKFIQVVKISSKKSYSLIEYTPK